ncbi:replication-associated recombination protein A [Macromonas bipunctata]|uniref:replication-associated recombination protein A n=1 Tax=Macromonas bipunctata TaxID=183670 RepID=UPI000C31E735|nr:replication-associated recombination protein A [Macromonas bipunctata]
MTPPNVPLAERLRPRTLADVVGQAHLLGPGRPLRVAFESGQPHSCILWGPPGVGKTTLARLMAQAFDAQFIAISAVLGGVKDIRDAVERAQAARSGLQPQGSVLFVDEIHRFNKSQQDALLPHLESGLFHLVGATTENPSFELNAALLSRAAVYVLQPLTPDELAQLVARAQALGDVPALTPDALQALLGYADGDARRLLNTLETLATVARVQGAALIDADGMQHVLGEQLRRFDKGGDQHYDQLSAFHKSIRGSQPDAALYWLARLLDGGADPQHITRRLVAIASEDIGNADPRALPLAMAAAQALERQGLPEGELALAQATTYLAVAPKSNAAYVAWQQAKAFVRQDGSRPVPAHLRNAPTALLRQLGHGAAYRYPHDETEGYAAGERYWPDGVAPPPWYQPVPRGLEIKMADKLARLRALDEVAATSAKLK